MKTHTPSPERKQKLELVTATEIAQKIGRSPQGVIDKLAKLGIQPEAQAGAVKFYRHEVTETVRTAMRAKNKAVKPNTTGN